MAFARIPAPGTALGPCEPSCTHTDCFALRLDAEQLCSYCERPIGYGRNYAKEMGGERLAHHSCLIDHSMKEDARGR